MIYPPFPNKFERALIMQMSEKEIIRMEDQTVFSNRLSFKRAMKFLHDLRLVEWKEDHAGNIYRLTDNGIRIAEMLEAFYELAD